MKLQALLVYLLLGQSIAHGAVVYGLSSSYDPDLELYAPTHLFRFSLNGSMFVDLGSVLLDGAPVDLDGLATSREFGLLAFQNTPAGSRLVRVDPELSTAELLAPPLFGREIRGATFSNAGVLWAVDAVLDQIVQVSPMTGEEFDAIALSLGGNAFDVPLAVDLAFDFSGRMMLVTAQDVYELDPATGAMSLMFTDSDGESSPASPTPPTLVGAAVGFAGTERLFGFDVEGDAADDVYTYDLGNAFARSLLFSAPLQQFDAGLGDLGLLEQPVESGDYNGDGSVDAADYTVWRDTRGSTSVLLANGVDSGTSMSVIDQQDYDLWASKFGTTTAAASGLSSVAVPEPNAWMLFMLSGFWQLARRLGPKSPCGH